MRVFVQKVLCNVANAWKVAQWGCFSDTGVLDTLGYI